MPNETLGPELVKNGNFHSNSDWIYNDGWYWGKDYKAYWDQILGNNTLEQNISVSAGCKYRVTFTVFMSDGAIWPQIGGTFGITKTSSGTYTEDIIATTTAGLVFHAPHQSPPNGYLNLDNVSVRQVMASNDGGLIAKIEQWIADTLVALTNQNEAVFKTAEVWKYQIGVDKAGPEAFTRYQPFAFVSYLPVEAEREGDYDLRQVLQFAVAIGIESKSDGVARIGDDNNLGISRIRELVIDSLDGTHPGTGYDCDDLFYTGEIELVDSPRKYAIQMHFRTNWLSTTS